jgi:hypothetical protein
VRDFVDRVTKVAPFDAYDSVNGHVVAASNVPSGWAVRDAVAGAAAPTATLVALLPLPLFDLLLAVDTRGASMYSISTGARVTSYAFGPEVAPPDPHEAHATRRVAAAAAKDDLVVTCAVLDPMQRRVVLGTAGLEVLVCNAVNGLVFKRMPLPTSASTTDGLQLLGGAVVALGALLL